MNARLSTRSNPSKYELNLKRDFPRTPFYEVFWKWSEMGKELMNLHINYEKVRTGSDSDW